MALLLTISSCKPEERLRNGDLVKIGGAIFKYISGDNIEQLYYEEIYRMAIIDGLTAIYNKRYFMEFLEREMARCARYDRPLALIIFDVDHFKRVNDNFGHLAGDYVLKQSADLISAGTIRKECFARYGGEEFVIYLPDTVVEEARILAEKIRTMVKDEVFKFEDNIMPITISLGVASFRPGGFTTDQFIHRADAMLYKEAKQGGRNMVCVDDAPG